MTSDTFIRRITRVKYKTAKCQVQEQISFNLLMIQAHVKWRFKTRWYLAGTFHSIEQFDISKTKTIIHEQIWTCLLYTYVWINYSLLKIFLLSTEILYEWNRSVTQFETTTTNHCFCQFKNQIYSESMNWPSIILRIFQ